jgi:hypothetical protein
MEAKTTPPYFIRGGGLPPKNPLSGGALGRGSSFSTYSSASPRASAYKDFPARIFSRGHGGTEVCARFTRGGPSSSVLNRGEKGRKAAGNPHSTAPPSVPVFASQTMPP